MPEQLVGSGYVSRLYGVSVQTIHNWIAKGIIPAPQKSPTGRSQWDKSEIDNYKHLMENK